MGVGAEGADGGVRIGGAVVVVVVVVGAGVSAGVAATGAVMFRPVALTGAFVWCE
jgi:hypothetical protein